MLTHQFGYFEAGRNEFFFGTLSTSFAHRPEVYTLLFRWTYIGFDVRDL